MRISDWSSDVCSSDLGPANPDTRKRNDRVVTQDAPSPFTMPSPPVRRVDRRECDQCAAGGVEGGPQPEDQSMAIPARATPRSRQPGVRDPRLDFFRGVAMLIIFVAHVPDNPWAGFIPARFGWSDATEMFVFCSGLDRKSTRLNSSH